MKISKSNINSIEVLVAENEHIRIAVAPAVGGKILSVYNKIFQKEFLWSNKDLSLEACPPGTDYDTNFWGGIDELIPNDIPENIDGNEYPDHGELWTTSLEYKIEPDKISVFGKLTRSGLYYIKTISLKDNTPEIVLEYTIRNESDNTRHFLWKLHAALAIREGDKLVSSAKKAKVVYPEHSRYKTADEFPWPVIDNCDASLVPPKNNTMDFFYLYEIPKNEMHLQVENGEFLFSIYYDKKVFPYQWYFASYGKFNDHYTSILEPASSMPVSVNEAIASGQCTVLEKGHEINTVVTIYAGKNKSI
jgi:hypothetical protein